MQKDLHLQFCLRLILLNCYLTSALMRGTHKVYHADDDLTHCDSTLQMLLMQNFGISLMRSSPRCAAEMVQMIHNFEKPETELHNVHSGLLTTGAYLHLMEHHIFVSQTYGLR